MSYRNNTYIAFDSDTDMQYYRTLQMWSENNHIDFDFYDAHDLNTARDSSQIESIEKQLRVRFDNSKSLIKLLKRTNTYMRMLPEKMRHDRLGKRESTSWEASWWLETTCWLLLAILIRTTRHISK